VPPAPARIATLKCCSESNLRKASAKAWAVEPFTALRASGRLMVTIKTSSFA